MPQSFVFGGNVAPCRFVTQTTPNRTVIVASSGNPVIGITAKHTHNVPGTIGGVAVDDGFAGISGMPASVYVQGDSEDGHDIWLELDGTVAFGDFLKPGTNNDGKGITASSDGDQYGARAMAAGVAGQMIKVQVMIGYRGA